MLSKQEFFKYTIETIKHYLPPSYDEAEVRISGKKDLGGAVVSVLEVHHEDGFSAGVDLDNLYKEYLYGKELSDCVGEAADTLIAEASLKPEEIRYMETMYDYGKAKENLHIRLYDPWEKGGYFQGRVHTKQGDYEAAYNVSLLESEEGMFSAPVTETLLQIWNIDKETLHRDALEAEKGRGAVLKDLYEIIMGRTMEVRNCLEDLEGNRIPEGSGLGYVLTNNRGIYGAGVMLQEDILNKVSQVMGGDYFVLPSSIHETIILPGNMDFSANELVEVVRGINETVVSVEERLSDKVLHYDSQTGYLENTLTWEMRMGKVPKINISSVSPVMKEIVNGCARTPGQTVSIPKYSISFGTLVTLQKEARNHGITQYLDFSQKDYDVVCDTRLAECFALSPEKTPEKKQDATAPEHKMDRGLKR